MNCDRAAKILVVLCVLVCGIVATPKAQAISAAARLVRADTEFQQKAWQAAADDYRVVVRDDPASGMGWFRLGVSLDQIGHDDEALEAYGHASQLGFQKPRVEVGSARILTRTGRAKDALEHMRTALDLGAPLSVFSSDPAFAPLRSLAEYAAIAAKAEEARFPCRAVHTFDFWVGEFDSKPWDQPDAPSRGQLHNTREYDGCVIVERWTAAGGAGAGTSMSFYDANRNVWRMIWNDDENSSNDFAGSYHDGAMRFEGWVLDANGKRLLASNVLQDVSPDVIRHIYSTSADNGKTWVVLSDGRFVRRKA
jgi:hypothetical protein